jgi:hypothetical protein
MSKLTKRHFWDWFKRNQQEYLALRGKSKKEAAYWLAEMNAHLRAYFKFFGFSLAWHNEGTAQLIITVHGKAMHFKKVDAFVATAPDIPGWTVRALEDSMPIHFSLEKQIAEAGIDPREFYFSFDDNNANNLAVTVYHPLCTNSNMPAYLQLAYEAIYNLLGERSFGLDLGDVEMANLSGADSEAIYPLEELPTLIGQRCSSIVVDQNGTLLRM